MRRAGTVAIMLLFSLVFLSGCLYTGKHLRQEYQKGYEEGRREESAKYKGINVKIAKQMIGDQQRSQGRIEDIIGGRISSLDIVKVDCSGDTAIVEVIGRYKDGRGARGVMEFVYEDGYWYLIKSFELEER